MFESTPKDESSASPFRSNAPGITGETLNVTGASETAPPNFLRFGPQAVGPQHRTNTPLVERMWDVSQETGYHPWAVYEAMGDAAKFDEWFAKLPADLTNVLLTPLYRLAETSEQLASLRKRETSWQPDANNLGDEYNGPIGEDERPHPRNCEKWARLVVSREETHRSRFAADIQTMMGGDVPKKLKEATHALLDLVRDPDMEEWGDCADGESIAATAAALRLCLATLCEVEELAAQKRRESLEFYRQQIELCEGAVSVREGGAN